MDRIQQQMLLGHSSLRTTARYPHVVSGALAAVKSPVESMDIFHAQVFTACTSVRFCKNQKLFLGWKQKIFLKIL